MGPIRICGMVLALLATSACAHKQRVRLDCVPKDITIYLDKVPLESVPDYVKLRTDQPHIFFFKGEGYESQMVVLDMEETEDGPALTPPDMCLDLNITKRSRDLDLNIED